MGGDEDKIRAEVLALLGELGVSKVSLSVLAPGHIGLDMGELRSLLVELRELRDTTDMPKPVDDSMIIKSKPKH